LDGWKGRKEEMRRWAEVRVNESLSRGDERVGGEG
jgi:hypothetical protein